MKHTITSIGFALLIVTSVFAMPMNQVSVVGTASASHDCDTTDAAVAAITFTYVNKDKCLNNHVAHAVEEVRDAETQQDKLDIYSSLAAQKSNSDVYETTYSNYLQDTESVAWNKAEVAIAESYENGESKSEAKIAAQQAIADYYAVKQHNLLESWNTTLYGYNYAYQRTYQESGITNEEDFIAHYYYSPTDQNYNYDAKEHKGNWSGPRDEGQRPAVNQTLHSLDLVNGSSKNVVTVNYYDWSGNDWHALDFINDEYSVNGYAKSWTALEVKRPNDNHENITFLYKKGYADKWNKIQNQNSELQSEADAFVESTWQDYQDDNIDSTDVINRNAMMFEYGTSVNNGNATYYESIGAAAGMGLDTPDLNGTGQMTISIPEAGNTYEGMVFARNAPNNTWETGVTYTPSEITGPVMIATVNGELFEVNRDFVIDSMTDKQGNEQTSVQTTNYNYQTANTTELNQKYNELLELTEELENRSQSVGTGGGTTDDSNSDPNIPDWLMDTYGGIPVYGFILSGLALAYVVSATRKD